MSENLAENELAPVEGIVNVEQTENTVDVVAEVSAQETAPVIEEVAATAQDDVQVATTEVSAEVAESSPEATTQTVESAEPAKRKDTHNPKYDAIYEQLKPVKESNGTINVHVKERIKGGLRVVYQDMPMFLPASHFAMKRNPTEQQLKDAIGKDFDVNIHEMQEDETKRKTVVVSRKHILEEKFWSSIKTGEVVEGPITSIASFGIFIDVYGFEGLIHISRLANTRTDELQTKFQKGQLVKALVVEVSPERKRIGLSTKELEDSPWKGISEEITAGSVIKGKVKRLTDFGAYVEVKPGVEGLCRTSEISWTSRFKHAQDFFQVGQEIDFNVFSVNEEKRNLGLSIKRLSENPWSSLVEKYPAETTANAVMKYLFDQGAILTVNDEVDGFMPRSRMRFLPKGTINIGASVEVVVDNIDLEKESLIISPAHKEKQEFKPRDQKPRSERGERHDRGDRHDRQRENVQIPAENKNFTLQDLLSDSAKQNLLNS